MSSPSKNPFPDKPQGRKTLSRLQTESANSDDSSKSFQPSNAASNKKPKGANTRDKDNESDQLVNKSQQNVHQNSSLSNDSTLDEAVQNIDTSTEANDYSYDHESTPAPDVSQNNLSHKHDPTVRESTPSPDVARYDPNPNVSSRKATWAIAIIVPIIAFVVYWLFTRSSVVPEKGRLRCEQFLQLHSKYPNLDRMLWRALIVGVERAINDNPPAEPAEPATFIFLSNSTAVSESLLKDVTQIALKCFQSNAAIWRSSYDFRADKIGNDYGVAQEEYREELDAKGVLVVRDLDQVPPAAAQVFFTICDAYEPLVPKAIIFFTINISDQPSQLAIQAMGEDEEKEASATKLAETILKDLWKREYNPDSLNPLLVRLTENVFKVY